MNCPRCDAKEQQVEVRANEGSAKCRSCGLVFDPKRARSARSATPATLTKALVAPTGFDALETQIGLKSVYRDAPGGASEVVLTRRWARTSTTALTLTPLVPLALGLLGTFLSLAKGRAPEPFHALGVLFFVLTALSIYGIVMWRLNSTRIAVEGGRLRISHGPLPWYGNRDLESGAVEQLFCDVVPSAQRNSPERYRVRAYLRGRDMPIVLVDDLTLATYALFIEETLERTLQIRNEPIEGELFRWPGSRPGER